MNNSPLNSIPINGDIESVVSGYTKTMAARVKPRVTALDSRNQYSLVALTRKYTVTL